MSVTTTVVMMSGVNVDIALGGGGGGSTTPGECITPANAETVSVRIRTTTEHVRLTCSLVVPPK